MPRDAQDHAITAASDEAVRAYEHAVEGYLFHRADTMQRIAPVLAADPGFGMAHVLKGYLAMTPFDGAFVPRAHEALAEARGPLARATPRERAHAEALSLWIEGEIDRALAAWEEILEAHPRDVLASGCTTTTPSGRAGPSACWPGWSACCPAGRTRCRAGAPCSPAAPSPPRSAASTPSPKPPGGRRSRSTRATSGPPTRWRTSWRCRAAAARASASSATSSSTGRGATPSSTTSGGTWRCTTWSGGSSARRSASTTGASATSPLRWSKRCRTSPRTRRTRPPCCSAWSGTAWRPATAGPNSPTRPRRASVTTSRPSPCRTG